MLNRLNTKVKQECVTTMRTARIHSIETMGLVDGPGIRTVFFLQGCPLRCAYCHNPDTQSFQGGKHMTAEDILQIALRYKSYYGEEGGITFSGGEPLAQGKFLAEMLPLLKENQINVCLDTSGYGQTKYYPQVLPYIDVMLLDVKAFNYFVFEQLVEAEISIFLNFINELERNGFAGKIWLRHVMLPGLTNDEEAMRNFVELAMPIAHLIDRIEILPYHTMGIDKYAEIGKEYRLQDMPAMDSIEAKQLERYANKYFSQRFKAYREQDEQFKYDNLQTFKQNSNFKLAKALLRMKELYGEKIEDYYRLEMPESYRKILCKTADLAKHQMLRKIGEFKDLGYIEIPDSRTIILRDFATIKNYLI